MVRYSPLSATIHRALLAGKRKKAKSCHGSHISVNVFGRYPLTELEKILSIDGGRWTARLGGMSKFEYLDRVVCGTDSEKSSHKVETH